MRKGSKHTEETRRKIGEALKGEKNHMFGKKQTEETRRKLSEANKNPSKETRRKMSEAHKNPSQETRRKFSESHKGKFGEESNRWRGDDAKYSAMHKWVVKNKGKASSRPCEDCGKQARDWSNIDHTYRRILSDYRPLCIKCHSVFDKKLNSTIVK